MKTFSIRPTKRAVTGRRCDVNLKPAGGPGLGGPVCLLLLAALLCSAPVFAAGGSGALPSADKSKLWKAWQLYLKGGENNLKSAEKISQELIQSSSVKAADRCFGVQLRLARYKKDNEGAIPAALEEELQKEIDQATAKEPNNYYCFSVQADIYLTQGKAQEALTAAKQAYMLNPGDGSSDPGDYISLFIMALASPGSVKDFFNTKSARGDYFARFLKRSVHSPYVAMDAGHICLQNGRFKQALEYYATAEKLFGESQAVLVQFYIGLAHHRSGDTKKAKEYWKTWLAKDKSVFVGRGRKYLQKLNVIDEEGKLIGEPSGKKPSSGKAKTSTPAAGESDGKKEKSDGKSGKAATQGTPAKDGVKPAGAAGKGKIAPGPATK